MKEQQNSIPPQEQPDTGAETETSPKKEEPACPSIFDKPDDSRFAKKAKQPRRHSRHMTNIIIALVLCVAVVLGGEGVSYLLTGQFLFSYISGQMNGGGEEDPSSTLSQPEQNYMFDYSAYGEHSKDTDTLKLGGIASVEVENPDGKFTVTGTLVNHTIIDEQTYEETTKEELEWSITKVDGVNITDVIFDPDTVNFILNDLLKIPYEQVYATDGNAQIPQGGMTYYEECGIDKSTTRCTVKFQNGAWLRVILGDQTPTKQSLFVGVEVGDGGVPDTLGAPKEDRRVYQVENNAVVFFLKDPTYFVKKQLIEAVEQSDIRVNEEGEEIEDPYFISGALSYFDALSVSGKNYPKPLSFKNVDADLPAYDSIYLMTAPIVQNVSLSAMETLLTPVADGLTAATCLSLRATPAQLKQYGLDQPSCAVRYVIKGKEYVLRIGNQSNKEENCYAVMVDDNPSIFEVLAEDISFQNFTTADYASKSIYSCDITLLKSIGIRLADGTDEVFYLTHGTAENGNPTLTVKTAKGKDINVDNFRTMYVNLLSLSSFTNVSDGKDAAKPAVTVTIQYNDYPQTDVIRLSDYTDRRYFMSLNGMGSTVVLSNNVDTFVGSVHTLLK